MSALFQPDLLVSEPRHAQVLPSFVVPFIKKGLKTTSGVIEPGELLLWTSDSLPHQSLCLELRKAALSRIRTIHRVDELLETPINVNIAADFDQELRTGYSRVVIGKVVAAVGLEAFPKLTLKQFKTLVKLPTETIFGILAGLEAIYWKPTHPLQEVALHVAGVSDLPRALSPDELLSAKLTLALPWVCALKPEDLRFPSQNGDSLRDRLSRQVANALVSPEDHAILERLKRADAMTWGEELFDVARHAAVALKTTNSQDADYKASIYRTRFGGDSGRTYEQTGAEFELSYARVWQVCKPLTAKLVEHPAKMPALERLLQELSCLCPVFLADANQALQESLGHGFGVVAAINFAKEIGFDSRLSYSEPMRRLDSGQSLVRIVVRSPSESWTHHAMSIAQRDCGFIGCTNFTRLAGMLAMRHALAVSGSDLHTYFSSVHGFRMLDAEAGWFTLGGTDASASALRIRKLMCVATVQVDIDEIATSLVTDDTWLGRENRQAFSVPPVHVLSELLKGWDWLEHNRHNKFWPRSALSPAALLSSSEAVMVVAIESFQGVASRQEITTFCAHPDHGLSEMIVNKWLASSPVFVRYLTGIYGLRGRPMVPDAINAAIERKGRSSGPPSPQNILLDSAQPVPFPGSLVVARVYQAYPFRETGNPAMRVVQIMKPESDLLRDFDDFTHAGGEFNNIRVFQGSTVWGVASAADTLGVQPGAPFQILFDLANKTFELDLDAAS